MWQTTLRPRMVVITFVLVLLSMSAPISAAQQEAPPTPQERVCIIPKEQPIHIRLAAGERKMLRFDSECRPNVGPDTSPPLPSQRLEEKRARPDGSPDQAGTITAMSSGANVCHAKSSHRDVAGYVLTEQELVLDWGWDYGYITYSGAGNNIARWLPDGWRPVNGPHWFKYAGSATRQSGEGWTEFTWWSGSYRHEHRAVLTVDGWGGCYADYYFSGSIVGHGYVTYATYAAR